MKRFLPHALAACGLMALATDAMAAEAYLVDNTDLYAGPDVDYPQISSLPAGMPVSVYGCTSGWEWCDVQANQDRGWVSGEFLQYEYQNQRVILPSYGAQIGIPIVAFSLGVYWQDHYRSRPWYGQRDEWSHRSFAHRAPPRPAHVPSHPEPARRPPVVNHGSADSHRGVIDDRNHTPNRPAAPNAHPAPAPRAANEHAAPTPHPASHPAPRAVAAHPPVEAQHPAASPAKTARPAPAQRPKPAPAAKKPPPNKESEKKDDGHG